MAGSTLLTSDETKRYARHIVLKGVGGPGQQKLKRARVLVIGAGGLGAPLIAYLAAAGVGHIGIFDHDEVALSNLQRQIIHNVDGIGKNKAASAGEFVTALNPHIALSLHPEKLGGDGAADIMADYEIIVDGTDSFATRAMIAKAAEQAQRPLVSGAVSMYDGQVTVFVPYYGEPAARGFPRFEDLYPTIPDEDMLPSCEAVGILGAVTGVIGSLMAMEVIKLITGVGEPLIGRLMVYDGRNAKFTELKYGRPPLD